MSGGAENTIFGHFSISPVSRKSAWKTFGFENVKLERNADNSGCEFWAWMFLGGGLKSWKKQGRKLCGEISPSNTLRNSPAIFQNSGPKFKKQPQIRSAEPRAQHFCLFARYFCLVPLSNAGPLQALAMQIRLTCLLACLGPWEQRHLQVCSPS